MNSGIVIIDGPIIIENYRQIYLSRYSFYYHLLVTRKVVFNKMWVEEDEENALSTLKHIHAHELYQQKFGWKKNSGQCNIDDQQNHRSYPQEYFSRIRE